MEVQTHSQQHPSNDQADVIVIMVPFPCQSHLHQLLQVSCLISSYNIPVHYACWATHIRQVKQRFNATHHLHDINSNIHFHEFPTPPNLSPSPFESSFHLRQPVAALLHEISPKARRVIVIHDVVMATVIQDGATLPNAESYAFNPISAITCFIDGWKIMGKPFQQRKPEEVPEGLPTIEESGVSPPEIVKLVALHSDLRAGAIFNSCRSIEGTYIDLLAKEHVSANQHLWAIGPLNLYESINSNSQHKCLEWLDKQAPKSVLYVSFGTTTSMTDEQIKELALGLEQSEQKFIWVFRDADKGSIFSEDDKRAELPEGYEERMKEIGMVVRDWAPQIEILEHPSTGGFMSHCGWNSCLESISMGVPIAAWPMHFDQPHNAFLLTNILKVALPVNQWALEKEEVATSSAIAKAVKRLMASEEGKEMRKRVEELGGAVRQSVKKGGVSRMELDSFIAHISR